MLKEVIFKSYILIILVTFTASGDYTIAANGDYIIPSLSIDDSGLILLSNKTFNNSNFKGEPSYSAEVQASSNRVNTKGNFSMEIFLSGVGDVDFAKMRVNIPRYIVKEEYVKLEEIQFILSPHELGKINKNVFITTTNLQPAFDLNIPDIHFTPRDIKAFTNFGETAINLEGKNYPPYKVYFNISPNAPAGDHNIHIKLFYKSNGKWYSETQIVPIHINNWYEDEFWQKVIIGSLIISIILQIISAWPTITDHWKKQNEKTKTPKQGKPNKK